MIKAGIYTVYHGEVVVPLDVYDKLGHIREYTDFAASLSGICNVAATGTNTYHEVQEWAEDSDRRCIERWVSMWVAKIKEWQTRINQGEFGS